MSILIISYAIPIPKMGRISALLCQGRLEWQAVDISHITLIPLIHKEITCICVGTPIIAVRIIRRNPSTLRVDLHLTVHATAIS
jgi:hypothetical protein